MKKHFQSFIFLTLAAILLIGCNSSSETLKLKEIEITIDGNPQEWAPFPIVHSDPEGDKVSLVIDISTVKAFADSRSGTMYLLVESYIPIQKFSSLELDLQYGEELYRVAFFDDAETPAIMAHRFGEDEWDEVTNIFGSQIAIDTAIEFSFPIEKFTDANSLNIVDLRIMDGICCNQYEWYPVDNIAESSGINRQE